MVPVAVSALDEIMYKLVPTTAIIAAITKATAAPRRPARPAASANGDSSTAATTTTITSSAPVEQLKTFGEIARVAGDCVIFTAVARLSTTGDYRDLTLQTMMFYTIASFMD